MTLLNCWVKFMLQIRDDIIHIKGIFQDGKEQTLNKSHLVRTFWVKFSKRWFAPEINLHRKRTSIKIGKLTNVLGRLGLKLHSSNNFN